MPEKKKEKRRLWQDSLVTSADLEKKAKEKSKSKGS